MNLGFEGVNIMSLMVSASVVNMMVSEDAEGDALHSADVGVSSYILFYFFMIVDEWFVVCKNRALVCCV